MKNWLLFLLLLLSADVFAYTRQDTLRGGNGFGRKWWDVVKYDLTITIDTATKTISGTNLMTYRVVDTPWLMQIDLQDSMSLQVEMDFTHSKLEGYWREGDAYFINGHLGKIGQTRTLRMSFKGKPRAAANPPWDGGFIWTKDSMGKPWISVACQGLGASSWWPCKDYQGDEPDSGMDIHVTLKSWDNNVEVVSNGRRDLRFDEGANSRCEMANSSRIINSIRNPINTYNTTFYIGDYAHWHDTLHGEKGVLDLDFYPLRYNESKARKQWAQAKEMLRCFEWWMGPYPFYEDGYKLVEAPYLGMEHQSAIAYGNHYTNGYYRPTGAIDRSGTGVGMAFDFIIIHESGHEWFGNSITAQDIADNWLHEGFTTYTETLFAEWIKGKDSAFAYATGEWKNIRNDRPVIGDYGVNDEGSSDKYDKGAAVVHMIRMMINDDKRFRELLRGLNRDFYHKIVTSKEVEEYISRFVGKDLKPFFDVYLRSTKIPAVKAAFYGRENIKNKVLTVGATDVAPGFSLPIYSRAGKYLFTLSDKPVEVAEKVFNQRSSDYLLTRTKD